MYDYLVDHALKNVWCTPDQDLQTILQPHRLSQALGVFNSIDVQWTSHRLPLRATRFHVYQIGQLHPLLLGLLAVEDTWTTMADACTAQHLVVDIYTVDGVQLPRCEVWYKVTADRNLIVAVKSQDRIPVDLSSQTLYIRFYTNAFFSSSRAEEASDMVHCEGKTCLTTADVMALQTSYNYYAALPGLCSAYVNGFLVDKIDLLTVQPGDVAEYLFDGSVKRVIDFPLNGLLDFVSTLDSKHKYLLHYPGVGTTIDFHDDLDFFVIKPGASNRYQGVYYHRNMPDAVRMVTHKDYSVPTPYVAGYMAARGWSTGDALVIRAVVREAGWVRPLVNEDNRIKELYKLSDSAVRGALQGLDSVVENWTAAHLEQSWYVQLMGAADEDVTGTLVENAYGYNAISQLLGNTPVLTHMYSGQQVVDVPYGLQSRSTAYEYDADGLLLSWFTHLAGTSYATRQNATRLVEMIAGDVADRLDETYGDRVVVLDAASNYRMYRCPFLNGVPTNQWEDVTGSGYYAVINNQLTWLLNTSEYYTLVRSDRTNLGYSLALSAADGVLKFSLAHRQLRFGVVSNWVMQIPMGELDVWLNGYSLIEGIDYIVHFPQVVVINKAYLVNPETDLQHLDIRFTGFCKADFSREPIDDVGFVVYGQLSHNNRYDIRDDKVMRIVVGGAVYERSELTFSEDSAAVSVLDARNGAPYMLRDIVVPTRGFTDTGTYELRAASEVIDARISAYMTLHHPEVTPVEPPVIASLYAVYSPFFQKVLSDLQLGILSDPRLQGFYNDSLVIELCAPYLWLLAYDPTQIDNAIDDRFVQVHPHNRAEVISVDIYHYKFLSRVVKVYLRDKVSLSHFLQLSSAS